MQYVPEGTEIILWGIGEIGQRVIEGKYGKYKISFAIDSKIESNTTDKIGDIIVYPPEILEDSASLRNQLLVIGIARWGEIAEELEKKGMHIFRDYVPYTYLEKYDNDGEYKALDILVFRFCKNDEERDELLKELSSGKKLCGIYGFCHVSVYESLLWKSKEFTQEYCMVNLRADILTYPYCDILCMPWIYSALNLLILTPVYPDKKIGTPDWKTVKRWAGEKCKVILVTNAHFGGYFPQNAQRIPETASEVAWGDKNINKMILAGETTDKIFQTISSPDFYDAENVNQLYETELKKLERVDSMCDVRIGDYIRKYGRQKRLMYSSTHPYECVMKEIAIRIFKKIGLTTEELEAMPESEVPSLRRSGEFIYPSVYQALELPERQEEERVMPSWVNRDLVTLSEYVDLYVKVNTPYIKARARRRSE